MGDDFTRSVTFAPALDGRTDDPKTNYGIRGVKMRMVLTGPWGVLLFDVFTGWHLPHVVEEFDRVIVGGPGGPLPGNLTYHGKRPVHSGHAAHDDCPQTGGQCFPEVSRHGHEAVWSALLQGGDEKAWEAMEAQYERAQNVISGFEEF